jgi:PhnB protein
MTDSAAVSPIPKGYHTITPYLHVRGAAEAIEFYKRAFGAEELFRMQAPGGPVMHAEMKIGSSPFMLSEEMEDWGNRSPSTLEGTSFSMMVYVEDCDALFRRAIEAGATEVMPLTDHFYGDRSGVVADPFGHKWNLSTHVEDVPPDEMDRRMNEMMGG